MSEAELYSAENNVNKVSEKLVFNKAPSEATILGDGFGDDIGVETKTPKTPKFKFARVKGHVRWRYKGSGDDADAILTLKRLVTKNGKTSVLAALILAKYPHGASSDEFTTVKFDFKPDNNPDNNKFWHKGGEGDLALYYYAGNSNCKLQFQDLHVEATVYDDDLGVPPLPVPPPELEFGIGYPNLRKFMRTFSYDFGAHKGKTYALVIGIYKYLAKGDRFAKVSHPAKGDQWVKIKPLKNATHDSWLIKELLESKGVEVFYGEDCNSFKIIELRNRFLAVLKPGDDAIVFFAGHGFEYNGVQRLLARALTKREKLSFDTHAQKLAASSLDLQELISSMQAKRTRVNVVLLDCCREYVPSEYEITRAIGAEKLDPELMRGLNPQAPMGTIIGFACDERMLASDGVGRNGLYTSHLKDYLGNDSEDIETNLKLTGAAVEADPNNTGIPPHGPQKPKIRNNLTKPIFLFDNCV